MALRSIHRHCRLLLLATCLVVGLDARATGLGCILTELRLLTLTTPELAEIRTSLSENSGVSEKKFGTAVYYAPQADPLPGYPEIGDQTRAVVVAFGGSGAVRATGRNWMQDAHVLHRHGVALVSFDYPFHAEGPRTSFMDDSRSFVAWATRIVEHYRASGKPIYLVGHSFGPAVIQEVLARSPNIARGAVLVAPGGSMTSGLHKRMMRIIADGTLERERRLNGIEWDQKAEDWSDAMELGFKANRDAPMVTKVPVLVMAGDTDPWSTPALIQEAAKRFPNGRAEIVPGIGHVQILRHKEAGSPERILTVRLLDMIRGGEKLALGDANRESGARAKFAYWFKNSASFRTWVRARGVSTRRGIPNARVCVDVFEKWWAEISLNILTSARTQASALGPDSPFARPDAALILAKPDRLVTKDEIGLLLTLLVAP